MMGIKKTSLLTNKYCPKLPKCGRQSNKTAQNFELNIPILHISGLSQKKTYRQPRRLSLKYFATAGPKPFVTKRC